MDIEIEITVRIGTKTVSDSGLVHWGENAESWLHRVTHTNSTALNESLMNEFEEQLLETVKRVDEKLRVR